MNDQLAEPAWPERPDGQRGMALPAVLTTLVIVAVLSASVGDAAITAVKTERLWSNRTQTDWILEAGLNRMAKALITPGDLMREGLFKRKPVVWTFAGEDLTLRVEQEGEKVDVNYADERVVIGVLAHIFDNAALRERDDARIRLQDMRRRHILLMSPDRLLAFARRFSSAGVWLHQAMTAYSGQSVPTLILVVQPSDVEEPPFSLSDPVEATSTSLSISRPIYRLMSSLIRTNSYGKKVLLSKDVILMLSANDQKTFRVIEGHL